VGSVVEIGCSLVVSVLKTITAW